MTIPSQKNPMNPNIFGCEIDIEDLDKLLNEIRIIAIKLTKIRACYDKGNELIATNNLWTLHWALKMLLQFMNQNNLKLLRIHLESINKFANAVIKEEKQNETSYLKTLLEMQEEYRV